MASYSLLCNSIVVIVLFESKLCAGGGEPAYSNPTDWMRGKKLLNVILQTGGRTLVGGLIESEFREWYDIWCWNYYAHSNWSWENNSPKPSPPWAHSFIAKGMYDMSRNGQKVQFTYQPDERRDAVDFTLTFPEEQDAKIFAGEVQDQQHKSKIFSCFRSE